MRAGAVLQGRLARYIASLHVSGFCACTAAGSGCRTFEIKGAIRYGPLSEPIDFG